MSQAESPQPLRNLTGALIAGAMSFVLYLLTSTIGSKLALSPIHSNGLATRISVVVRTALLSVATGATMIFGIVAIGLLLLTIQQLFTSQKPTSKPD